MQDDSEDAEFAKQVDGLPGEFVPISETGLGDYLYRHDRRLGKFENGDFKALAATDGLGGELSTRFTSHWQTNIDNNNAR